MSFKALSCVLLLIKESSQAPQSQIVLEGLKLSSEAKIYVSICACYEQQTAD
jgi:hypothetical protein